MNHNDLDQNNYDRLTLIMIKIIIININYEG